jgi:hypothetical protein
MGDAQEGRIPNRWKRKGENWWVWSATPGHILPLLGNALSSFISLLLKKVRDKDGGRWLN